MSATETARRGQVRLGMRPARPLAAVLLLVVGAAFLLPLVAMLQFTFRDGTSGGLGLTHWAALGDPAQVALFQDVFTGLGNSLAICAITVAIVLVVLVPTMILAELSFPRARRVIELVCILPLTVPTVVLVVGFVPVYQVVSALLGSDAWTLAFAVGVIVLPFAFRPVASDLQSIDVRLLAEAARSLGASWATVLVRVILPNLTTGILAAVFLTIAVVLGEYTIASFLSRTTFQTALLLVQQTDPYVATIFALLALVFAFVLLVVIGRVSARGRVRRSA